jgi:predicted small secreted protein
MKFFLILTLTSFLMLGVSGCGIIGGAGRDISSVGHVVTKSANML